MKKTITKILAAMLAVLMMASLVACAKKPDEELEINVYLLNGTTALGASKMIADAKADSDSMNYNFQTFAAADAITGAIVSGEADIAALPTNVAAKLYKNSEGKLQLLALNTLGVLHLLQNGGDEIDELADLKGRTIYLPGAGSNPEFITAALLESAGLKVGDDVILDTTSFNSPDALATAIASGVADLAVLPEPKVTVTMMNNANITKAIDFSAEWEKLNGENTLVQGCLVVNTAFAEEHPAEVKKFLEDYTASVEYIKEGSDDAIQMIVDAGILPKAPIAKKALPSCNLCSITGADMEPLMKVFYEKLYAYNPASVGAVPDADFYYVAK
ncbi:MAG: ABC transporter substrate-binding protein [Clostridia bacterium]|nr:ABC transporter substrate-binding protein [Clostridia bacterium]